MLWEDLTGGAQGYAGVRERAIAWRLERLRALHALPPDDRRHAEALDRQRCSEDPVYFFDRYAWIKDPKPPPGKLIPMVLWPSQRELLEWLCEGVEDEEPRILKKGRELGISWLAMVEILRRWLLHPGFSAHVASRKQQLVDDRTANSLLGKFRLNLALLPSHLRPPPPEESEEPKAVEIGLEASLADPMARHPDKLLQIRNPGNGSLLSGESTNAGLARGGRAGIMLLDEFDFVERKLQAQIWGAAESVASSLWVVSTVNRFHTALSTFHQLHRERPARMVRDFLWESDPRRDAEWYRHREELIGETVAAVEHAGSWTAGRVGRIYRFKPEAVAFGASTPEWAEIADTAIHAYTQLDGIDVGSGASEWAMIKALVEWLAPGGPRLWVREELILSRVDWRTGAAQWLAQTASYGGPVAAAADPAADAPESDQSSWARNLQMAGIPATPLAAYHNTVDGIWAGIDAVNLLLAAGRLRVDPERCPRLWEALEEWSWSLPEGVDVLDYAGVRWAPRHDRHSHPGHALRYLVAGLYLAQRARESSDLAVLSEWRLRRDPGGEVAGILGSFAEE